MSFLFLYAAAYVAFDFYARLPFRVLGLSV